MTYQGTEADNKSTFVFIVPKTPGNYKITFKAQYIFNAPDKDGEASKEIRSTKTYTVEACDVRNSFWGEDLAETMLNQPSLKKQTETTYGAMLPDLLSLSNINRPLIATSYIYTGGKLSGITEIEKYGIEKTALDVFRNCITHTVRLKRIVGATEGAEIVTWADKTTEVLNTTKEATDEYKTRIGQSIIDKKATVTLLYKGPKTDAKLSVEGETPAGVRFTRLYQKAGTLK